jgi:hypothetical protein
MPVRRAVTAAVAVAAVALTWWFLRGLRGDLLVEGALSALNRLFLGGW